MWRNQYRGKWFWTITVANATVCVLVLSLLYAILSVLAAFAAGIESWPLVTLASLLALGFALSVVSYPMAKQAPQRLKRWLGYGVNDGALLVYLTLVAGVAVIWLQTARRLFLVPAGFQGELYLVHDSKALQRNPFWRT